MRRQIYESHEQIIELGDFCDQHLQQHMNEAGEQRKDRQQAEETGRTQTSLQPEAFPEKRHHVEVEMPIIDVVQRGQEEAVPLFIPVHMLEAHTGLRIRGIEK